jgi:succinoglycan biosynthesis transport protein ExoP
MSLEQLIAILRARWLVALIAFTLVATGVTVYTLLLPKSYTASGSVLVDIRSPDPIAGSVLAGVTQPSFLMTQIDILTSTRVAQRVVSNLKLADSPDMNQRWRAATGGVGDFERWVVELIRKGLEAHPSRGSNVIYVSYTSADPKFAAAIVNAYIEGYLDTDREMRNLPAKQFSEHFDATAKVLKAKLEAAQTKLSAFQQEQELVVSDERMDIETTRLNQLASEVVSMQANQMDTLSRQNAAQTRADQSPDVMANPMLSSLRGDLIRQEGQLEQLSARLGDQHPQVVELQSAIGDLRHKIDIETRRVTASLGVSNTVSLSRVAKAQAALDAQRSKVLKLKTIRDQADVLVREVDSARRSLEGVNARLQNTSLESQAQTANIAALESARAPSYPSAPRTFSNIALGLVAAAVVALVAALVVELRDRRLRTLNEVEAWLGQPLLGAIPAFKKPGKKDQPSELTLGLSSRLRPALRALPHSA